MVSWRSAPALQGVLVQKEWGGDGFAISCQPWTQPGALGTVCLAISS